MDTKNISKEKVEVNRKKLLVSASILFILAIVIIVVMLAFKEFRAFDGLDKYPTKTLEKPDEIYYPGNISEELKGKLRYLPDDAIVRVTVSNFPLPIEMSKADILVMANAQPELAFDIA